MPPRTHYVSHEKISLRAELRPDRAAVAPPMFPGIDLVRAPSPRGTATNVEDRLSDNVPHRVL